MSLPLHPHQKDLALRLFDLGAVQIAPPHESGWKLRRHQQFPYEPLSPIYFNLRTKDNPKPGPLTTAELQAIGHELYQRARPLTYEIVLPVPNAGNPLAEALIAATPRRRTCPPPQMIRMEKQGTGDNRQIVGLLDVTLPVHWGLLLDDLITGADSKLEAVHAARSCGIAVKDCLVLIDREQGGAAILHTARLALHAVFTVTQLVELYLAERRIDDATASRVRQYIANNKYT